MTPFVGFRPDASAEAPGIFTACSNIIPTLRGFAAAPSAVSLGISALAAACRGAALITKLDGSKRVFAGTQTKLYELVSGAWTDVSRGGSYTGGSENRWRFAQFADTTVGVNLVDSTQYTNSGNFADLAGAPKAAVVETVAGFVMVFNTIDGTYGTSQDRWWCSGIYDATLWTPSVSTQATTGRLVDAPGDVRGAKRLADAIVAYKERAMWVGRYVGAPAVWQFSLVPGEIGCASHEAIASIDTAHIFPGYENFYEFDGVRPVPVGDGIKEWFFNYELDSTYRYRIQAQVDRNKSIIYFYYPKSGGDGSLTGCLAFNYVTRQWAKCDRSIEAVITYLSGGYTYNTLDTIAPTYDTWPAIAYDSPFWTAQTAIPAIIDTTHTIKSLTGTPGSSSITTGNFGSDLNVSYLDRVRLRFSNGGVPTTASMTTYRADTTGDTFTSTGSTTMDSDRNFFTMQNARWFNFKFDMTGSFETNGIQLYATNAGTF